MKIDKKKGFVSIGIILVLLILTINFALAQEKVEVSMSVWGMPWEDFLYNDVLIPKFEAQNPNISVKFNRYEDYSSKLIILFAAGEAPDVMRDNMTQGLGLHIVKNMLMPLDDFIKGPNGVDMSDYIDVPFKTFWWTDHIYFLPTDINNYNVLSYNKDLFNNAGIEYPDYSWTLQNLENAAKKLTGEGKYGFLWELPFTMFYSTLYQMGGNAWDPKDIDKCILNSPEAVNAIKLIQKWIFDDKIVPMVGSGQIRNTAIQMFTSGRLGMFTHGGWLVPDIKRDAPTLNFGTTLFPRGNPDRNPGGMASGCCYVMNKNTKHPQEAWNLLKFLTSTEGILDYWSCTWVATPARYSVLDSPEFRRPRGIEGKVPGISTEEEFNEKLQWHIDALENKWFSQNIAGKWQTLVEPSLISPAMDKLIGTQKGVAEEVLNQLVKDIQDAISKNK